VLNKTLSRPLAVNLPVSIEHYRPELESFIAGMFHKLAVNSHKDAPAKPQIPELMFRMMGEIGELVQQILADKFDPNSLQEAFDVSNFAFLTYLALLRDGVKDLRTTDLLPNLQAKTST
jgi:hypothetical protein